MARSVTPRVPQLTAAAVLSVCLALAGCTVSSGSGGGSGDDETDVVTLSRPAAASTLVASEDPVVLALATSQQLFDGAPLVVLASAEDRAGQLVAATVAVSRGVPLLLVPEGGAVDEDGSGADGEDGSESEPEDDPSDTEPSDTAPSDTAPSDTEPSDTEPSDTEPSDTEPSDTEPSDTDPADTEPGEAEALEAELPRADTEALLAELTRLSTVSVVTVGPQAATWVQDVDPPDVSVVAKLPATSPPQLLSQALDTGVDATPLADENTDTATVAVATLPRNADRLPLFLPAGQEEAVSPPLAPTGADDEAASDDDADNDEAEDSADDSEPDDPTVRPVGGASVGLGRPALPRPDTASALSDVVVVTTAESASLAAVATARAAGAPVHVTDTADLRSSADVVADLSASEDGRLIALGDDFGPAEVLGQRARTAATGVELPGGGQLVAPGKLYIALYGHPATAALGVLGEQGPQASVERARDVAAPYEELSDEPVVPTFEIIATVASGAAGPDGNYSTEATIEELRPLVDAAAEADILVVLDLQPGRTDFLTQAKQYEELLLEPHVGLALDPEWRLKPNQVHLRQIGTVDAAEVNTVVTWLADLVAENDLPQKALVLHQFRTSMITNRSEVDTSRDELAVIIHADGQGPQGAKLNTWRTLRDEPLDGAFWGWKNFYDEDQPTLSPEGTMQVEPTPMFVSYQ